MALVTRWATVSVAWLAVAVRAWAGSESPVPSWLDATTGQIDGRIAVSVVPAKLAPMSANLDPVEPWGFAAHLVSTENPSVELVYPCGTWFQPPKGSYRAWIEGDWQISPYSRHLSYSPSPFRRNSMVGLLPTVPAGRVRLQDAEAAMANAEVRLLQLGPHVHEEFTRWELSRRKPAREVGAGLLMPEGKVVAALWSEEEGRYTRLSRPFEVRARETTTVSFERPQPDKASLVVQIQRPGLAKRIEDYELDSVSLTGGGATRAPDALAQSADRLYAIWYGLAAGSYELKAQTPQGRTAAMIELRRGGIARHVSELEPLDDWTLRK